MNYYKRNWNETRGDQYDSWGKSVWFFETDNNGKVLKYDNHYIEDEYGRLAEQSLDLNEFVEFKIEKREFENIWK